MMKTHKTPRHDRVILFTRYPIPGKTKKRLIPALGPINAADLHRHMTEKMLGTARTAVSSRSMEVVVCFEGGTEAGMRRWLGTGLTFVSQVPGDLGERMAAAFAQSFRTGAKRVLLFGADIPEANDGHIREAFDALWKRDLVMGPTADGGYWLIGMKEPLDLFKDIPWGTEKVFERTAERARERGMTVHSLPPLMDMDRIADVERWMPQWCPPGPYLSVIIPALNEAPRIGAAIRSARGDEVEIIVADGGSTDGTETVAREAGVRVLRGPAGRAAQQNRAAALARGKVLLFLHADTCLPHDYACQVFQTLMDRGTVLGAFRFRTDLNHPMMKGIQALTNARSRYLGLPYGDQGLFVLKSVFREVAGFPDVPFAEDLLFVRKLKPLGRIGIAPGYAVTSARRWRTLGLMRTTLLNQVILAGCYLGVPFRTLLPFYRKTRARMEDRSGSLFTSK